MHTITNFLQISPSLLTGGMPSSAQLVSLRNAGVNCVINLALNDSPNALTEEPHLVHSLGMEYVHIPVIWTRPLLSDLALFFDQMTAWQKKVIFVHCVLNMRVSVFVYLYRVLREGMDPQVANQDVLKVWQPDETWQAFIQESQQFYLK